MHLNFQFPISNFQTQISNLPPLDSKKSGGCPLFEDGRAEVYADKYSTIFQIVQIV